ncbi:MULTISPECIES: KaiC domain-containing protein [Halolamina]|uniref:KaiC domain protein, AF_0351 family n=1 Tax=Halolamina pelagica TaxID=699431 RepID=A0A1I5MFW9_9EURY|nr:MULTISPECIES: KaiC domain-containing protein [Halolamina]NHX36004.1 KaiC domain-containing protein [Halolamina sp. R1-12]SFP08399.1 KaiC domain protein, AF_0351 family [Halolamina pelagica]
MSDDEEEDWFERAMRETEGTSNEEGTTEETADDADIDDGTPTDGEALTGEAADETPSSTPFSDSGESGAGDEGDPFGGDSPDEGTESESDPFGGVAGSGERTDPFGDAPGFGEGGGSGEQGTDDAPGGFGGGGEGEFGGGEGGFGDGEGGFGGSGEGFGGGQESFEDAELESDIDRVNVGIEGLDEMILGGVPKRSLMVAIGAAGTGKTTFGLQFLTETLQDEGRAIYITLEESREAILSTAEEKGWPFREWRDDGRLAIVSMDPIEMANSLSSIRNDISRLVEEFSADRLVLDSVSLLEMMYDHPAQRRSEVFDFARSLKRAGVTTMLTSEASSDDAYTSRYGIIEYLVDAVFILQYVRPSDFRETRLAVEIQKIRDANHSRETKPYEITNEGISVYRQANIF